jgi:hypothetical protein
MSGSLLGLLNVCKRKDRFSVRRLIVTGSKDFGVLPGRLDETYMRGQDRSVKRRLNARKTSGPSQQVARPVSLPHSIEWQIQIDRQVIARNNRRHQTDYALNQYD